MSQRKTQAQQLIDNPLLAELIDNYKRACYDRWLQAATLEDQQQERACGRAASDIGRWLRNMCEDIANGQ